MGGRITPSTYKTSNISPPIKNDTNVILELDQFSEFQCRLNFNSYIIKNEEWALDYSR